MEMLPISFMSASQATPKQPSQTQSAFKQPSADRKDISLNEALKEEGINFPKLTPLQSGMLNAVSWFGFGFLFERLFGKVFPSFRTPLKLSLIINGAIGLISGGMSYIKTKKAALNADNK